MALWIDTPERHGRITRLLHWAIAALLLWQIAIVIAYRLTGGAPLLDRVAGWGPSHGAVGLMVLPLALLRILWWRGNRARRAIASRLARMVHGAFYALVALIPALGLLRAYGSGKGWEHWGLQIVPQTGVEVPWMVGLGNLAHGELAWLLAALIAGHVAMALWHGLWRRDGTLGRMAGR